MALAGIPLKLRRSAPSLTARLLREPLLHFALLGAAIFVIGDVRSRDDGRYRIVMDDARIASLAATYARQFGAPPSPAMLHTLVDNDIDQEILYREGLAMGLDRDDEVIRRRIVQKVQFLAQDLAPPAAPSEAALWAFYGAHPALYTAPARVSFSHVFFSPDQGGDARSRAQAVLATLDSETARAPERGDPYPDRADYSGIGPDDAQRLFGKSDIASALFRTRAGQWAGPFRSGYGWHLVRVSAVAPARLLPFAQVHDDVRTDYLADAQASADMRAFTALKAHYTVVRP